MLIAGRRGPWSTAGEPSRMKRDKVMGATQQRECDSGAWLVRLLVRASDVASEVVCWCEWVRRRYWRSLAEQIKRREYNAVDACLRVEQALSTRPGGASEMPQIQCGWRFFAQFARWYTRLIARNGGRGLSRRVEYGNTRWSRTFGWFSDQGTWSVDENARRRIRSGIPGLLKDARV